MQDLGPLNNLHEMVYVNWRMFKDTFILSYVETAQTGTLGALSLQTDGLERDKAQG